MKKFIILAITILAFTFSANAQYINYNDTYPSVRIEPMGSLSDDADYINKMEVYLQQLEIEYDQQTRNIRTGWILFGVGSAAEIVGIYMAGNRNSSDLGVAVTGIGGIVSIIGCTMSTCGYIKRASISRKKADAILNLSFNGLTVTF